MDQNSSPCRKQSRRLQKRVSAIKGAPCVLANSKTTDRQDVGLKSAGRLDLEKGAELEKVVLSIHGMTCTSCARKVQECLSRMVGISSVNVNFMSAKGEFLLNAQLISVVHILAQLRKETGFVFTRLDVEMQFLDVSMDAEKVDAFSKCLPAGVSSIERQKQIYRITYDPVKIGARHVFEISEARSLGPQHEDAHISADQKRLVQMSVSFAIAMIFTIPVLVLQWSDGSIPYTTRSIIALTFATVVQAVAIYEFCIGAIKSLIFSWIIEMDMLITISVTAAYSYSVVAFALTHAGYVLEQGEFFETSTLLVLLILLGRLISAYARRKAIATVSSKSLQTHTARLILADGQSQMIDARLLQYGDKFLVPPHSRIVTDGEIVNGTSSVDESMHTGESTPVYKDVGHQVTAGTMNAEGALTVRLTRLPGKNSLTEVASLVEAALSDKPKVQDLVDQVAGYFTPAIVIIALLVFTIWTVVSLKVREFSVGNAVGGALTYSIAVLAISCPCALGLAVPMVLFIAGGVGARHGVVIKRACATERAHKVTDVIFDKTGTLTHSLLQVQDYIILPGQFSHTEIDSITLSLVRNNVHPVSMAVFSFLEEQGAPRSKIDSLRSIPGKGLEAIYQGKKVQAGSPYWLDISNDEQIASRIKIGETLFCVMVDSTLVAVYCLKATLRSEAISVVRELSARGITCHVVSGDGPEAVSDVALTLGIIAENTMSRHSPSEKQAYVQKLMDANKFVMFCGDGTNDAIAVAQAHIGIQVGNTSDITSATADVVLLGDLGGILKVLDLSKAAFHRIIFNFIWSAIYNVFAILLAAGAFVTIRIPPAYAGLGEIVSVLPVILAALTLLL